MHTIRITDELYSVLAASAERDTRSVTEQLSHILKHALNNTSAASTQQIAVDTKYAPGDLRNTMSDKEIIERTRARSAPYSKTHTNAVSEASAPPKLGEIDMDAMRAIMKEQST